MGHVARRRRMKNKYKIVLRRREGKRAFQRPRRSWKHRTPRSDKEMDLAETKCDGQNLIHLTENKALINTREYHDKRGIS